MATHNEDVGPEIFRPRDLEILPTDRTPLTLAETQNSSLAQGTVNTSPQPSSSGAKQQASSQNIVNVQIPEAIIIDF